MDRIDAPARRHVAERQAMRRAIELARSGLGSTFGNPCVGAVVLDRDLAPVGTGRTEPHGTKPGRHAEVVALAAAGESARGGTAVVTLEPCNGTGRTGPCTDALVAAGVARVVYAVPDPMPPYAGGADALRGKGIDVDVLMTAEAREVHGRWVTAVSRQRPYVTLKIAATLDGRIAASDGTSRWITGPEARQDGHRLRGEVGAVVVGSGTILADDPLLTVRGTPEPREPLRVVLDRRGRTPADARVRPALVTAEEPAAVLADLYARDVRHVLLEGGPTVAGAFVAAGLVDEVVAYLAPALLGAGLAALRTCAFPGIDDAVRLELADVRQLGGDVRLTARVKESA
ncbi:MAG TPA: bifunctional diaminohydroxyphosphoribosylaminopyrimidine deaminase/5-amino-6-(5-phosphoribosylamino)uracil reductase RibD [Mycobacteriales bacterium]